MKVLKVISCKCVGAKSPILPQTPTIRRSVIQWVLRHARVDTRSRC
jgi:hypothetical protein